MTNKNFIDCSRCKSVAIKLPDGSVKCWLCRAECVHKAKLEQEEEAKEPVI